MCLPMAVLSTVMTIAGTIVSGIGQHQQYQAQAQAYDYSKKIEEQNASIEQAKQKQLAERSAYAQRQSGLEWAQRLAQSRSSISGITGSGLGGTSGDALVSDVMRSEEIDRKAIAYNAVNAIWGSQIEETNSINKATQYDFAASSTRQAGALADVGTFLSVGSQVAGNWKTLFGGSKASSPVIPGRSGKTTVPTNWGR